MFEYSEATNHIAKYSIWGGVIIVLLTPFVFIVMMSSALDFGTNMPFPSDAELIENFQNNKTGFEKLNQMAKEDSDFVRVANDFNWTKESAAYPRSKAEKDLSEQRWNDYRSLFLKLKLKDGILNYQPNSVWFTSSSAGMVTGGSSKGFVFSTEEPSPLVDSLDEPKFDRPELTGKSIKTLYRKLQDNWYLFYETN